MYSAVLRHQDPAETKPLKRRVPQQIRCLWQWGDSCWHQTKHSNKHVWRISALFWLCSAIREKDFKDSTVCVGLTPLALTRRTSRRRMQQRKTGKCQERLTKRIAQRLPFKSKAGRQSRTHKDTQTQISHHAAGCFYYNNLYKNIHICCAADKMRTTVQWLAS